MRGILDENIKEHTSASGNANHFHIPLLEESFNENDRGIVFGLAFCITMCGILYAVAKEHQITRTLVSVKDRTPQTFIIQMLSLRHYAFPSSSGNGLLGVIWKTIPLVICVLGLLAPCVIQGYLCWQQMNEGWLAQVDDRAVSVIMLTSRVCLIVLLFLAAACFTFFAKTVNLWQSELQGLQDAG